MDQLTLFQPQDFAPAADSTQTHPQEPIPPMDGLLAELRRKAPHGAEIRTRSPNRYLDKPDDQWRTWDAAILSGRDYLVGSKVPLKQFLRGHTTSLNEWQQAAYRLAWYYPAIQVLVHTGQYGPKRFDWVIYRRGEYVDFSLPHQDAGGERDYISRDGRRRVLINLD